MKISLWKNTKKQFVGHPLNPGPLGPRLWKRARNSTQDSLNESSVRPNGTPVMPILRSRKTQFLFSSCLWDFSAFWVRRNHHRKDGKHPLPPFWSQNQLVPCLRSTSRLSGGDHSSYKSGQRTKGWPHMSGTTIGNSLKTEPGKTDTR